MSKLLDELADRLDYDPSTGKFIWVDCRKPSLNGEEAGVINSDGYRVIRYKGKLIYAHRLAWYIVNGDCPKEVDHKNLIKSDNAIDNLRAATHAQNSCNTHIRSNNKSGYKGVYWNKRKSKWHAAITVDYKSIHLGYYERLIDAANAYKEAAEKFHGNFARID